MRKMIVKEEKKVDYREILWFWLTEFFQNSMNCGPPAPLSMGILQARKLESIAISISRGTSQPRDPTQVFCIAGGFFTVWATREVL